MNKKAKISMFIEVNLNAIDNKTFSDVTDLIAKSAKNGENCAIVFTHVDSKSPLMMGTDATIEYVDLKV